MNEGEIATRLGLQSIPSIAEKIISPIKKASTYPDILLAITFPTAAGLAANEVSRIKVVETGILNLVRMRRKIGAAICRKWNSVGATSKPLASNLSAVPSVLIIPIKNSPPNIFVKAITSPLGDHTGVAYLPSLKSGIFASILIVFILSIEEFAMLV